jgi:predicted small secreted protein
MADICEVTPMNTNKKKLLPLLFVVLSLGVSACNTVQGAGQDIKSAGQAIDKTAEEAKP